MSNLFTKKILLMADMIKVFSTPERFQLSLAKALLKEAGIDSFEMNKQDSAYLMFGNFELYAPAVQAREAIEILKDNSFM